MSVGAGVDVGESLVDGDCSTICDTGGWIGSCLISRATGCDRGIEEVGG